MLLESLTMMLRGILRIPPGAQLRKADGPSTSSANYGNPVQNDYVSSIVDITVDDICIGDTPLSLNYSTKAPSSIAVKFDQIKDECNTIVKWVARDLCTLGFSVYKLSINKSNNRLIILPTVDTYEFYLTRDKRVVAYTIDNRSRSRSNESDLLIFINYSKSDLVKIEDTVLSKDTKLAFKINPSPFQVKNLDKVISAINQIEDAIVRDRALSRNVRWVDVDVGISQGTTQKQVVDSIASAINADSTSLTGQSDVYQYDDNIPVIPNRNGKGKPEMADHPAPKLDNNLEDLQYFIGKLNLGMRFPGSYLDFSKELAGTAASLLRSDQRYSNLCSAVRSKIETTFNDWILQSKKFARYTPVFTLYSPPSVQSADVVEQLDTQVDFASKVEEFIVGTDEDVLSRLHRLQLIQDLFATATTSPLITKWLSDYRTYLKSGSIDSSDETFSDEEFSTGSSESVEESSEPEESGESGDIEYFEPQTS